MKKFIAYCITAFLALSFAISAEAAMNKDEITLYGDNAFIQEILKGSNDTIVSNAIYVSPNGSDTNSGTLASPYKTVQKALDTVKAGQTIYLRQGTYTALNTFKSSGTEGNYITLRNYPGEKPYLTMTAGTSGAILSLEGNKYIKIEGLEIGGLSAEQAFGILINADENHIIIRNNDIHNLLTTKPGENENGEANAILCYGEGRSEELSLNNICIENNTVHHNTTGWCESVSVTGNAKYVNIINNTVHDNTNIGIDFYGNAGYCSVKALDQPRYCVAAGNTVYNSICGYAECAGLYVDGARDVVLENNTIYGSMYGIEIGSEEGQADYPVKNIIARNNLVYNNSAGGIRVGGYDTKKTGYVTDTKIYNNTLVNNGSGEGGWNGEFCFVKCNGIDVRNNIVYKDSTEYPMIGGDLAAQYVQNVKFNNNVYYNPLGAEEIYFEFAKKNAEGMTAFNAMTGGNDTFGKPDFNTDYSLKKGSYGIDMGSSEVLPYMGTNLDLANNRRVVNIIDVGAFEYQDGSAINRGDVNKDGKVNDEDAAIVLRIIAGIISDTAPYDMKAADCNSASGDGNVNIIDAIWILNSSKSTEITTEHSTEATTSSVTPTPSGAVTHNFTADGLNSSFFTITGNLSSSKGTANYNGMTLTQCLKIESSTSITFNAPSEGTLVLVFGTTGKSNCKIDGTKIIADAGTVLTTTVSAGSHTINKADTANLFYMSYTPK